MLIGFGGHLIAEQFLEQSLTQQPGSQIPKEIRRELAQWRERQRWLGPASSLRSILEVGALPLIQLLGFDGVHDVDVGNIASATVRSGSTRLVLLVSRWGERLEPLWRPAVVHALDRGISWCVLFNGTHVRLVHAARTFSRRFVEFDLDCALDDERTTDAMWRLIGADAFGGTSTLAPAHASRIEALAEASDRHAVSVCSSLRDGVLEASTCVLQALAARPGSPPIVDAFEQALTIVYRLLFLFFAEARSLLPLWHPIYRNSYSLETLRDDAVGRSPGLWDALRAITRLAHAGCRTGDLQVTPFNGRLFAPSRTPLAERRDLDNDAARQSLVVLSTRPSEDREGREPISYRDLGVEQLGAVYETLLDYQPVVERRSSASRRADIVVSLRSGSGLRKSTGTFYTPQPIVAYLVRQAIGPLVRDAEPEQILNLRILDPSMGSGAFLVGACTFLADAYETALLRTGRCHPSDIGLQERAVIRRTIAERCLYGVDLNPMAVQLARLSLWLATLAANRPLSFLDHHLQVGDSLLGTWVSRLRNAPSPRRHSIATLPLLDEMNIDAALREALPVRFSLAERPNDTPEQVRTKERALAALNARGAALAKWKQLADLWCASWFSPQPTAPAVFNALADTILTDSGALPASISRRLLDESAATAFARRFFHWELEFPEVFFDRDGHRLPRAGFDAVIGNPPWDMVRDDAASTRERSGDQHRVVRFTRDAGVYNAQSAGHANRYQMFLERSIALCRPGGALGLVLPAGLATDQGSAALRRLLFSRCAVDKLVGFDNRHAIFPIHRSVRFLLVSAQAGRPSGVTRCRFGETDVTSLERLDEPPTEGQFPVTISPALLQRLSGDDLTIPDLRTPTDVAIAERAATLFPPLGSDRSWNVAFGRELNATEDRALFRSGRRGLPVLGGRQIAPFRAHTGEALCSISARDATRRLGRRHQRPRLAYRDVASATNRITLIAALLPAGCVSTHTLFCLKTDLPIQAQHFLCGLFNSIVVNYLVRLRVTSHVTTALVEQLPVPRADQAGGTFAVVASLARKLAQADNPALLAELNARVAALYGLTAEEFAHVLGTFPLIPSAERQAAERAFTERR